MIAVPFLYVPYFIHTAGELKLIKKTKKALMSDVTEEIPVIHVIMDNTTGPTYESVSPIDIHWL